MRQHVEVAIVDLRALLRMGWPANLVAFEGHLLDWQDVLARNLVPVMVIHERIGQVFSEL